LQAEHPIKPFFKAVEFCTFFKQISQVLSVSEQVEHKIAKLLNISVLHLEHFLLEFINNNLEQLGHFIWIFEDIIMNDFDFLYEKKKKKDNKFEQLYQELEINYIKHQENDEKEEKIIIIELI